MSLLTRQQIDSASDLPRARVAVPEWGDGAEVLLQTLSLGQYVEFSKSFEGLGEERATLALLAMSLVDEAGVPLFGVDEVDALGRRSKDVLLRLSGEVMKLNKFSAEAAEETAKN